MNQQRRSRLREAAQQIDGAIDVIRDVIWEESSAMNNMPENLQGSERYAQMEDAVDTMEEAADGLSEISERIAEL